MKSLIKKIIDKIYQFFFPVRSAAQEFNLCLDNTFKEAGKQFLKLDETIRKTMKLLSQNEIKDLSKLENFKKQSEDLNND
jgi:hypothetical protein